MQRTTTLRAVPILALSLVLVACGQVSADQPSASPSLPVVSPTPSEQPSEKPEATPRPTTPVGTPVPSEKPADRPSPQPASPTAPSEPIVIEHPVPMIARVTHDGLAVRNLPDLESALVAGNLPGDRIVENIRLRSGDEVVVILGPVYADGHSWYEVVAGAVGPAEYFRGWVAGEFLEHLRDMPEFNSVAVVDGQGFSASASGSVAAYSPLVVNLAVTPMPGDASCSFELVVIGTEGQRTVISQNDDIGEASVGQVAAPNLEELTMKTAGYVSLEVTSDCSFAVAANVPQG